MALMRDEEASLFVALEILVCIFFPYFNPVVSVFITVQ